MSLILTIPISDVRGTVLHGFEGFVLIWGRESLKIYKEVR